MTDKYYLGRVPSEFDARDFNLRSFIPKGVFGATIIQSKNWEFPSVPLAQGETNHCVGFSMADFQINLPTHTDATNDDGHRFYYICKEIDNSPKDEGGSNVRSAAKALQFLGRIKSYAFAHDVASIKWWLLHRGPIIAGTVWTQDMFNPDFNNVIRVTGTVIGGHAYLLNEWRIDNYIGIQNSWGDGWGKNGKAYISSDDFSTIFRYGGEAMTSVELSEGEGGICTLLIPRKYRELKNISALE